LRKKTLWKPSWWARWVSVYPVPRIVGQVLGHRPIGVEPYLWHVKDTGMAPTGIAQAARVATGQQRLDRTQAITGQILARIAPALIVHAGSPPSAVS